MEGEAHGLFVFGDSYTDTGESAPPPYGMTWPGVPGLGNRSSDGRNEVDYFGTNLNLINRGFKHV